MIAKKDCPACEGTGTVRATSNPPHPPSYRRCECILHHDILANVERGMKNLSSAEVIKESRLTGLEKANIVVTAGSKKFKSHLRHLAVRQPPTWSFKVVSDAELVTAWLSSTALKGVDIIDPDAYMVSTTYLSIPDLVMPPGLLVIRMGVKVARNQASPEVLAEAVNLRSHSGKPTWIWDEPTHPLGPGHLFWSDAVADIVGEWEQIKLVGKSDPRSPSPSSSGKGQPPRMGTGSKKSLRGGSKG